MGPSQIYDLSREGARGSRWWRAALVLRATHLLGPPGWGVRGGLLGATLLPRERLTRVCKKILLLPPFFFSVHGSGDTPYFGALRPPGLPGAPRRRHPGYGGAPAGPSTPLRDPNRAVIHRRGWIAGRGPELDVGMSQ